MSPGLMLVVIVVMAVVVVAFVGSYNRLVDLRSQLERAWANIDVLLKQRFDEIPQLVQVIEQYASYESGLLGELAAARSHYGAAASVGDKISASNELGAAFRGLLALGEAYPELRSNQNFMQLQQRITALEEALAHRRETYNECVALFNARIAQIPDVLAASFLGYQRQESFVVAEAERARPGLAMNLPRFGRDSAPGR